MAERSSQVFQWKAFTKVFLKFSAYVLLFCLVVFLWLVVASHFYFEDLKIDRSEMVSDLLDEVSLE